MTRNRLTVEELAKDTLDVRELNRAGLLTDDWITLRPSLRWPRIATMRLARYRILLELRNQSVPQGIRVSWTRCHFGGFRPWLHCPHCERRVARLFKGFAGYFCRACWVEHLRQCADLANLADRDLPEDRIWCRWLKIPDDDREPEHQRI